LIVEYDKVVIGSSLHALLYAFKNRYPVFFSTPRRPFRFDYFDPHVAIESMKLGSDRRILRTPTGDKPIGLAKELLWERLIFLLSTDGLAPLANLCHQLRYTGEGVVCTNEYARIYEFSFNTCYYFGDDHVSNLVAECAPAKEDYICYDYIAFHKGGKHEIDYIHTGDGFVGEIWFYSSDRIDGNTGVKDACVVSRLSASELLDSDYSETMSRFKMEKVLQDNGMRGPLNGYDSKGHPKHYKFKTSHLHRHKEKLTRPTWAPSSHIKRAINSEEELIAELCKNTPPLPSILRCDYTLPA